MKNTIKTLSLSAAALMTLMVGVGNVQAATVGGQESISGGVKAGDGYDATEENTEAESTAEFTVEAGKLTLDAVPDMNFGTASVQQISTANTELKYDSGILTGNPSTDGNDGGKIQVSDFRGTGLGWNLSVKLGTFTNSLTGATLELNAPVTNKSENGNAAESLRNVTLKSDGADQKVVTSIADDATSTNVNEATGMGVNIYTITKDSTTLTIDKNPTIKAGTYQADLTWTLANTPSTTAAK